MTAPAPVRRELAILDRDIIDAFDILRTARVGSARTPNARTAQREAAAELRLNGLLERRYLAQQM